MKQRRIGFEVCQCARVIRRYMDSDALRSYADEMTGTHGWAIGYFYHNRDKDIFQKDFEKKFDIRRSTASKILSLMEKNGLIIRQSVPEDARLKKIILTPKAVEAHEKIEAGLQKMEKDISSGISEDEMNAFFETIGKIKRNIERMTAEND